MFNEDDFKNLEDSMEGMPDGLVDASDYTEDMELITDILSKIDYDNMMSRMEAMMYIINNVYDEDNNVSIDRVSGTIIALCFHIVNIVNSLEEESREDYFNFTKNEIIGEIKTGALEPAMRRSGRVRQAVRANPFMVSSAAAIDVRDLKNDIVPVNWEKNC